MANIGTITVGGQTYSLKDIDARTSLDSKAEKATTLSGYGISDCVINGETIVIGNSSVTVLTSEYTESRYQTISGLSSAVSSAGFANTSDIPDVPEWALQSSKPDYSFAQITNNPSTLSGYGITDCKISSGVIIIGEQEANILSLGYTSNDAFPGSEGSGLNETVNSNNSSISGLSSSVSGLSSSVSSLSSSVSGLSGMIGDINSLLDELNGEII